jgi:hypothetical protein
MQTCMHTDMHQVLYVIWLCGIDKSLNVCMFEPTHVCMFKLILTVCPPDACRDENKTADLDALRLWQTNVGMVGCSQ